MADIRRKTARLSIHEIPEILQRPILLHNYKEVESIIENLSPLGIGLLIDKNIVIVVGDIFHLKYYGIHSEIKCVCVYSDEDGGRRSIGAYFTDPEDQKVILKYLNN